MTFSFGYVECNDDIDTKVALFLHNGDKKSVHETAIALKHQAYGPPPLERDVQLCEQLFSILPWVLWNAAVVAIADSELNQLYW